MPVWNLGGIGSVSNTLWVSDEIFWDSMNHTQLQQSLTSFQANAQDLPGSQLTRGEVKHSTRKLYKQKGTGKARAGMSSSPIRRGGGRAFPSSATKVSDCKINKSVHKKVVGELLRHLVKAGRLLVVSDFSKIPSPAKTKQFRKKVVSWVGGSSWLLVADGKEMCFSLHLTVRNLPNVHLLACDELSPRLLLLYDKTIVTEKGILQLQRLLQ